MKLKSSSKEKKDVEDKAANKSKNKHVQSNDQANGVNASSGIEVKKKFDTINRELNEKFKLNCMSSQSTSNNNQNKTTVNTSNLAPPRRALNELNELDFYNNSIDFDCDYDYDFDDEETTNLKNVRECKCCSQRPPPPSVSTARLDLLRQLKVYLELTAMYPSSSSSFGNECGGRDVVSMSVLNLKNFYSDETNGDVNSLRNHDESFISTLNNESMLSVENGGYNNNTSNNNRKKSTNEMMNNSLCIDDSRLSNEHLGQYDEENNNSKNNLLNTNINYKSIGVSSSDVANVNVKFNEKIKPLIPLNVFFDDTSDNHLNNNGSGLAKNNKCSNETFVGREWIFKEIDKVSFTIFVF